MGSWTLLLSIGGSLVGVLMFGALVADEITAGEVSLEYRRRIEAEEADKRRAREAELSG
jgi:hypothetical protein